ncbi:MAG: cytochrome c oxidase subunit 3 [Bacteroidia bacterium]|nr:cytochrome c oxidase subunit 3 [Bacteroidia bacterium]
MVEERNYLIHPHYLALGLLLAGITTLFLGFSAAYLYNRFQSGMEPLQLPWLFVFNTVLLIATSFILKYANQCYISDQTKKYQYALGITLLITLVFLASQIIAWRQMYAQGIFVNYNNMASYLYIISGVHFAHVIGGIPFLTLFLIKSVKEMKEPVSVLIYFSDPDKLRKLNLLTIYWHFLDALWVYLVIFFLVNSIL